MRANLLYMYTAACALSNMGRPLTDNNEGRAVAEIEALRDVEAKAALLVYHLVDIKLPNPTQEVLTSLTKTLNKVKALD